MILFVHYFTVDDIRTALMKAYMKYKLLCVCHVSNILEDFENASPYVYTFLANRICD